MGALHRWPRCCPTCGELWYPAHWVAVWHNQGRREEVVDYADRLKFAEVVTCLCGETLYFELE